MTWTIGLIENFDPAGSFRIGAESFSIQNEPSEARDPLLRLISQASSAGKTVAVRPGASGLDLAFPRIGQPTLYPDSAGPGFRWLKLSRSPRVYRVDEKAVSILGLLAAETARETFQKVVALVPGDECFADLCGVCHNPVAAPPVRAPLDRFVADPVKDMGIANGIFSEIAALQWNHTQVFGLDCIPFDFPDEGCEAKAHKAWSLLPQHHQNLFKTAISRSPAGKVCTPNTRDGYVCWKNHIALSVYVGTARDLVILDPTLFKSAVQFAVWEKIVLNGATGVHSCVPATAVSPANGGEWYRDDHLTWSNSDLTFQRLSLENRWRCLNKAWPPYSSVQC